MDDFLAHAIVNPPPGAGPDRPEVGCAKSLSLEILGPLSERPLARTWRARTHDGRQVALVVIADAATEGDRERFARAADRLRSVGPVQGTVRVHAVSPAGDAFVTDLWTMGCATDLPALRWSPRRRLQFVRCVAQSLNTLHRAGIVHGCLCGDNVLLDDDLQPVLAEPGMVSMHGLVAGQADLSSYAAFSSPEVKRGEEPDARSDIWSAGHLLEQLIGGEEVMLVTEIVRRCGALLPQMRYSNAEDLVAAIDKVIAVLPTGDALNRVVSPPPPEPGRERQAAAAKHRPVSAPHAAHAAHEGALRLPALVGAASFALAAPVAFLLGARTATGREVLAGIFALSVALATWAIPPLERMRVAARVAIALSCATLAMMVSPIAWLLHAGAQWRLHGDDAARRVAIADIMDSGRDFSGMRLSGLDLSGLNLTGADFRRADLSHADFSGACLWLAQLEGASLDEAQLFHANLEETELGDALRVESAQCDPATRLPQTWQCVGGKVSHQ